MTRWLARTLMGLCSLTLTLADGLAQGQGVTWGHGPVPAVVTWQRPVDAESEGPVTTPAVRFQAAGVAVIAESPRLDTVPGLIIAEPPSGYLPHVVAPAAVRARLGRPVELPAVLGVPSPTVPVQFAPPPSKRENVEQFTEASLLPTTIQLSLPGPHRLFRLDSEADIKERIRQEARQTRPPTLIEFPEPLRGEPAEGVFTPRLWPLSRELVEPAYVNHRRLLFEQINSERYGWSLGVVQPALSALHFYADVATLPYHLAQEPGRPWDSNAGKCLPGDAVPLYLYPPRWSVSGLGAEAAIATLLFFAFP